MRTFFAKPDPNVRHTFQGTGNRNTQLAHLLVTNRDAGF
ncbi:hypothetical protein SV7mr_38190 [Stieleria bergensis]|uniref:Uncharacterized protein n=1 Tax=Stieleria bergensis TaxID=2528025 RepID=A0A517SYQ4_9BACT|nr:hypothetical protein SV7mr_38190 [Planctomycetes bacterium SV_7m_r]